MPTGSVRYLGSPVRALRTAPAHRLTLAFRLGGFCALGHWLPFIFSAAHHLRKEKFLSKKRGPLQSNGEKDELYRVKAHLFNHFNILYRRWGPPKPSQIRVRRSFNGLENKGGLSRLVRPGLRIAHNRLQVRNITSYKPTSGQRRQSPPEDVKT
jgi:hypothetical protein